MDTRLTSPRSLAARIADSFAWPRQSSCLSITQVGEFFRMRRMTEADICTPVETGWSCKAHGTFGPSVSLTVPFMFVLDPSGLGLLLMGSTKALMEHEGRAVVFENAADMAARIDDPELDVTADDVLVLKRIGPKGHPGMPEAGALPMPMKLARQGVKGMLRISDGRMSGTAFGTVVLHVTPEAAVGGPLAWVRNGDRIRLSVSNRELALLVSDKELPARTQAEPVTQPSAERGYRKLFLENVTQADRGVDFAFLAPPANGKRIPSS